MGQEPHEHNQVITQRSFLQGWDEAVDEPGFAPSPNQRAAPCASLALPLCLYTLCWRVHTENQK